MNTIGKNMKKIKSKLVMVLFASLMLTSLDSSAILRLCFRCHWYQDCWFGVMFCTWEYDCNPIDCPLLD